MNRAQRRMEQKRPSGRFTGELAHRATNRAYRAQLQSQIEQERNGMPIPPDIAASMTQPRKMEALFQIGVTLKDTGAVRFLGPMMSAEALGPAIEAINRQILTGARDDWTHAEAYPMSRIQGA